MPCSPAYNDAALQQQHMESLMLLLLGCCCCVVAAVVVAAIVADAADAAYAGDVIHVIDAIASPVVVCHVVVAVVVDDIFVVALLVCFNNTIGHFLLAVSFGRGRCPNNLSETWGSKAWSKGTC